MNSIPADATEVSLDDLAQAAGGLADKAAAQAAIARMQREAKRPLVRSWVFHLGIIGAKHLGREEEFIPLYNQFLAGYDAGIKPDWHADLTERFLLRDILSQSGRINQSNESFRDDFARTFDALGPPELGPLIDVGCAGGAFAINLARFGYQVVGTDHHAGIVEQARRNAQTAGVADKTTFLVDDACASSVSDGAYSRAICISVTPSMVSNQAFESLIAHLDRITRRSEPPGGERRVFLGHNRWEPSRLTALRNILQGAAANPLHNVNHLHMLQVSWWMYPTHLEVIRKYFNSVTPVGKVALPLDGERVDLLLK